MSFRSTLPRLIVGAIFVYASAGKIIDPSGFAQSIANYRLLPDLLVNISAIWLPWLELFVGVALLSGRLCKGAAALATLLMTAFTAAVASAYFRGLDISCGCFTQNPETVSDLLTVLVRDLALSLLCLIAFIRITSEHEHDSRPQND